MRRILVPALVAAIAAATILLAGGWRTEVALFATIAAGAFAVLARRACGEAPSPRKDPTDLASAIAFFAVLVAAAFDLRDEGRGLTETWLVRAAGTATIAAGVTLRARAVRALGDNYSVRLAVRDEQLLVDRGPYRWIRHPNYAALLLVACGTALAASSLLALAVAVGLWLPVIVARIDREERMMIERFDARYRAYMNRTWRLIVGVY